MNFFSNKEQLLPKDILNHSEKLEGEQIDQAVIEAIKNGKHNPMRSVNSLPESLVSYMNNTFT